MKKTFNELSRNGNNTIVKIFSKLNERLKDKMLLYFPDSQFSTTDCIAVNSTKKYLVEHKNRMITDTFLTCLYDSTLLLERRKFDELMSLRNDKDYDDILYINTLQDGTTYIFKLNDLWLDPERTFCPKSTAGSQNKISKPVYKLDVRYALKIKI